MSSFSVSNITYTIISGTNVSVTGNTFNLTAATAITIPATVTFSGTTYNVVEIGDSSVDIPAGAPGIFCGPLSGYTFTNTGYGVSGFSGLYFSTLGRWVTAITLPSSLTKIGRGAFSGLLKLTAINGSTTFTTATTLTNITHIGVQAFYYCGAANSGNIGTNNAPAASSAGSAPAALIFNANTTNIGGQAFEGCSRITTATFNQTTINTVLTDTTSTILNCFPYNMFHSCTSLTTINGGTNNATAGIPPGITKIFSAAFAYCTGIKSITTSGGGGTAGVLRIPTSPGIATIDSWAFYGAGLTAISFPSTLTLIQSHAFGISAVPSLNIPSTVTTIEDEAFRQITSTSITLNRQYDNLDRIFAYYKDGFAYNTGNPATSYITKRTESMTRVSNPNMTYNFNYSGLVPFAACFARSVVSATIGSGITGIDHAAFESCGVLTSITFSGTSSCQFIGEWCFNNTKLPQTFIQNLPASITHLYSAAFRAMSTLTNVIVPATVTAISSDVFNSCTNLLSLTIRAQNISLLSRDGTLEPNTLGSVISECPNIKNISCVANPVSNTNVANTIVFTNTVTKLGQYFFSRTGVTNITIPNNISIIGNNAFDLASALTAVTIPANVTTIQDVAFAGTPLTTITIPSTVTSLGNNLFLNCNSLKNATIQSAAGVTNSMFYNCTGMTAVTLSNITKIGDTAFFNCSLLSSITIPTTVTSIGNDAFDNTALTSIEIPSSVSTCGSSIFTGANSLRTIILNSYFSNLASVLTNLNNTNMSISFNYANEIPASSCLNKTGLIAITIGTNITQISNEAFRGCTGLLNTIIPPSVTAIGDNAFNGCSNLSSVTTNIGLRSIGLNAFQSTNLTSIIIPSSLNACGNNTFLGCNNLRNIVLNAYISNTASVFAGINNSNMSWTFNYPNEIPVDACNSKSNLTSVTISNLITNINNGAFSGCTGLSNIIIGSNVTNIGNTAFLLCTGLTGVTIGTGVKTILTGAFGYCSSLQSIVIPSNVTACGNNAFQACSSLSNIKLDTYLSNINLIFNQTNVPNTTYIFDYAGAVPAGACDNKTNIRSVTLGNSINSIESSAFNDCIGLTGITFPYSLTNIGPLAFTRCTRLSSINIPSSVITINYAAFSMCKKLKNVTLENGILNINNACFAGCSSLSKIIIPNSVINLEAGVFNSCIKLKDIILSSNINKISDNLFFNCTSLASIKLPNNVTSINSGAFRNCTNLLTIEIPKKVTSIGASAFSNCTSLAGLVTPKNVTTISDYVFSNCSALDNLFVSSDAIIYKNNFYGINPNANIVLKNVSNIANQSNNIVWYSISLTLTSNNQNIFNGYFCVDSSIGVINAFYNETNLNENLIGFTDNSDIVDINFNTIYPIDNLWQNGYFSTGGTFIKNIPYLDNIYNSNGWILLNGQQFSVNYRNKTNGSIFKLPNNTISYTITQLSSNPIPLPTQINISSL